MKNAKWTLIAVGYQTGLAYAVSLCIYQFGMLFTGHGFNIFTAVAIVVFAGLFICFFADRIIKTVKILLRKKYQEHCWEEQNYD